MGIIIADFAKETISLHGFSFVTSVSASGINEMTRVFGYSLNEEDSKLTVLVYKGDVSKLLDCFTTTNKVAVVITDGLSFKTIQIKGDYLSHRDATQSEIDMIDGPFYTTQNEVIKLFGMADGTLKNWHIKPTLAIEIICKEIYDQTPRQKTGNKIS